VKIIFAFAWRWLQTKNCSKVSQLLVEMVLYAVFRPKDCELIHIGDGRSSHNTRIIATMI
jgi:hypothetical protein